jgi:hypothetical protein
MANHRKRDKDEQRSAQAPKLGAGNSTDPETLVGKFAASARPRKPIDAKALSDLTDGMRKQTEPAGEFVRRMRDDSRY